MTARGDSRRLVHGQRDVVAGVSLHRVTGVHAHVDADGGLGRPALDRQALLGSQACRECSVDVGEDDEAVVTLVFTSTPPHGRHASRRISRWRSIIAPNSASPKRALSAVDPSTSVKQNVTAPLGNSGTPAASADDNRRRPPTPR